VRGRVRPGWYRDPRDPPDHVHRVARVAGTWIASQYDLRTGGPCAAGVVVRPGLWESFEPYDGPLSPRMRESAPEDAPGAPRRP